MTKASKLYIKIAKLEADDTIVGGGAGLAAGTIAQQADTPKIYSGGKYRGKKMVYYNPGLEFHRTGNKKLNKQITKARVLWNRARHPVIPIYTEAKKIPKGSVAYNYSELDLKSRVKPGVSVINNVTEEQRQMFTNKHRLQTDKAFTSRGISTKTETVAEYLQRKVGKNITDITPVEAEKTLIKAEHKFIKPMVGTRSKGVYVAGDQLRTAYDKLSGPGPEKHKAGQPALKTVLDNKWGHIIQDKLEFKPKQEFRVHIGPDGIDDTVFQRWGRRAPVSAKKNIDNVFLEKLHGAHKEYTKGMDDMIVGYDVAKTNKGWKIVEGNIQSDFLAAPHWRAKNLKFRKYITGKGITGKAIGVGAATTLGAGAVAHQLTKKAEKKRKKDSLALKATPVAAGTAVGAGTYIHLRKPDYHHNKNIARLQRESRGKVTSIHYGTGSKIHQLANKAVMGGSVKYIDQSKSKERKGPFKVLKNRPPKHRKGTLYVGHKRWSARGWDPDVGVNMWPGNQAVRKRVKKDVFGKQKYFKKISIENLSPEEFLKTKGYTPEEFLKLTNDQWETKFKEWHKTKPIFVKQDSSNMAGIYGDLDKIRHHTLQDVEGKKIYVPTKKDNYNTLRRSLKGEDLSKGINKGTFLFGGKINPKHYKEYRVHMLNGHFLNSSPRWGDDALIHWNTDPKALSESSVRQLEKGLGDMQRKDIAKKSPSYKKAPKHHRNKYIGMDVFIDTTGKRPPKIVEINSSPMTAGMPMTDLRHEQAVDVLQENKRITTAPSHDSAEWKAIMSNRTNKRIIRKARLEKAKNQYAEAKAFYRSLTGRKEFRNVAVAKAAVPAVAATALTGAGLYGLKKKKQKR